MKCKNEFSIIGKKTKNISVHFVQAHSYQLSLYFVIARQIKHAIVKFVIN